jgi:predicted dinucleotide-binding enzyme
MATAIIGVGRIGSAVAKELAGGGEQVILASRSASDSAAAAETLGGSARSASVRDAIADAESVVFAVWFPVEKELVEQHADLLVGKVVIDPSNPVEADCNGEFHRTLADGVSSGAEIAAALPPGAHFVKAFGTLAAETLESASGRAPRRATLFYATDDDDAAKIAETLIDAAGFDAVKAGGVGASIRIEVFGDLHESGGLEGRVLDSDEARRAADATE